MDELDVFGFAVHMSLDDCSFLDFQSIFFACI